ncbi:hypothetical protein Q6272_32215, partial [Klebsiella pneumoniae]|nr:hypothetical protein [Klebsiella pneumoniae]
GRVTLKLERLTEANSIDHGQAHDALSDVRATIALARLVREKQPKLYDWLFQLRRDHARLLPALETRLRTRCTTRLFQPEHR